MSPPPQIVLPGLNNDGPPDDRVRSDELDDAVLDLDVALPLLGDGDVPEVPHHPLLVVGGAVVLPERVEDAAGGGVALAEVAEDVDVEAVLAGGQAGYAAGY